MTAEQTDTSAGPEPRSPRSRLRLACVLGAAVSGLLLFLAFPPPDFGILAFIALVPLLLAVERAPGRGTAALCGAVAGLAAYLPAFRWVASVALPGWFGLVVYASLFMVAACLGVRSLQRVLGPVWPLAAALLWVALEFVRLRLGPGLPWLLLGYTQHRSAALVQTAALGGVYAVGFVVLLTNAALAGALSAVIRRQPLRRPLLVAAGAAILLAACLAGGSAVRLGIVLVEGPTVGVVQQNIPRIVSEIYDSDKTDEERWREVAAESQLCGQLTARLRDEGVRLAVWPETSVYVPLDLPAELLTEPHGESQQRVVRLLRELGRDMGCHFLVGAPSLVSPQRAALLRSVPYGPQASEEYGNSAIMLSPRGEYVARYDKIRLVPFGEYIPLREALPFLTRLTPIPREITPGWERVIFSLPPGEGGEAARFSALVCYEDVFPGLCRDFRRRGAQFLVNITDEGWYHIPGELRQHLAMAVFRAVETRTTVVRAANTGISCFIDPRGDVYAELEPLTQGALAAPVYMCDATTPYMRYGDAFAWACLVLTAALLVGPAVRRRLARPAAE